jgi:hypothetical protein
MKFPLIVASLALFFCALPSVVAARTLHIPLVVVQPLETERIDVPSGYSEVVIDEVRVIGPAAAANSGLRISRSGYHPFDDIFIDIRINHITSTSTSTPPRLELVLGEISIRRLVIDRTAQNGTGAEPIVNVKFVDGASAASITLSGGRYDEMAMFLNLNWSEPEGRGRAAAVRISSVSFRTLALEGLDAIVPVTLTISATPSIPAAGLGGNELSLDKLQVLDGAIRLTRDPPPAGTVRPTARQSCTIDENRLALSLVDVRIGVVTEAAMMAGDRRANLTVSTNYEPCIEVMLAEVDSDGTLDIEGGVFGVVVIDGYTGAPNRGDLLVLRGDAIETFRMVRASIDNMQILASNQASLGTPSIPVWGSLEASGTVQLPSEFYASLDYSLRENGREQSATMSGVRSFLVDTRWRSFAGGHGNSAASTSLYIVLSNDARNIYGPVVSAIIDWFTGYGVNFWKPSAAFLFYFAAPLVFTVFWLQRGTPWVPNALEYLKTLVFPSNASAMPKGVGPLLVLQRYLFLLQITLVSLFIQNAVLVGP